MSSTRTTNDRFRQMGIGVLGLIAGGATALLTDNVVSTAAVMAGFFIALAIYQYRH